MHGNARMKPNRRTLAIASIAVLAVLASLAVTASVIARLKPKVVEDRVGDGGSPGYCDIVRATSKLARHGRIRHTVKTKGPIAPAFNAPPVYIKAKAFHGPHFGSGVFVLFPDEGGVHVHIKNHRTVVYTVKRRTIKNHVHRRDRYFWLVDQVNCQPHDDFAPDHGSVSQRLQPRHHHRRHR
jgi:hypothetical protein